MLKIILLGFAFYLVYIIFFKKSSIGTAKKESKKAQDTNADEMIACNHCHTYTTVDEMLIVDGKYYCCKECAKEAA